MCSLAVARPASTKRPPRIHVVGSSPRSGTTLMFELLTSCFEVGKFGDHEISLFSYPARPDGVFVSKKPNDLIHVSRVINWDPMLHVIYMQRDPRDVVTSRHNRQPDSYYCDFDIWRRNDALFLRLSKNPRLFECRYEELAADPDRIQAEIERRFGFLQRLHAFSDFDKVTKSSTEAQRAMNGVRQVTTSSVGRWRQNLPRLAGQIQRFPDLPQKVVAAGYETDLSWTAALEGVTPDRAESERRKHGVMRGRGPARRAAQKALRRMRSMTAECRYILGLHDRF